MKPITFQVGDRFGRLVVTSEILIKLPNGRLGYHCLCDCGNQIATRAVQLKSGKTRSCGCLASEQTVARNFRHGSSHDTCYHIWKAMIDRCGNPNNRAYHRYGGRGIRVCDSWLKSPDAFIRDMGDRPENGTLERIDNNKGYCPDNCKWATRRQQSRNREAIHRLTYNGETHCLTEWSEKCGFSRGVISKRLNLGWPVSDALTKPQASHPKSGLSLQRQSRDCS